MAQTSKAWPMAQRLIRQIESGEYPPGSYLPSVRMIARGEVGGVVMASMTASRALQYVVEAGLAETVSGLGTRVLNPIVATTV